MSNIERQIQNCHQHHNFLLAAACENCQLQIQLQPDKFARNQSVSCCIVMIPEQSNMQLCRFESGRSTQCSFRKKRHLAWVLARALLALEWRASFVSAHALYVGGCSFKFSINKHTIFADICGRYLSCCRRRHRRFMQRFKCVCAALVSVAIAGRSQFS